MARHGWSDEDRAEYAEMLEEAFLSGGDTSERLDALEGLLAGAVQARRYWARDVEREALRAGLNKLLTDHSKRREPPVCLAYNGRTITKPRRRGVRVRVGTTGVAAHQQSLWEDMTWDQFDGLYHDRVKLARAAGDELRLAERLRELHERHPGTVRVADALAAEGVSLDQWLAAGAS